MLKSLKNVSSTDMQGVNVLSKLCAGLAVITVGFSAAVQGQVIVAAVGGLLFSCIALIAARSAPMQP